jgi:hypothetical protein
MERVACALVDVCPSRLGSEWRPECRGLSCPGLIDDRAIHPLDPLGRHSPVRMDRVSVIARCLLPCRSRGNGGNILCLGSQTQHTTGGIGRYRTGRGPHSVRLGLHQPHPASESALKAADANGIDYDARAPTGAR